MAGAVPVIPRVAGVPPGFVKGARLEFIRKDQVPAGFRGGVRDGELRDACRLVFPAVEAVNNVEQGILGGIPAGNAQQEREPAEVCCRPQEC